MSLTPRYSKKVMATAAEALGTLTAASGWASARAPVATISTPTPA